MNFPMAPQSFESEQSVLGGIMLASNAGDYDRIAAVTKLLKAESFYSQVHQRIYAGVMALLRSGNPVDLITLQAHLEKTGELDLIGGFPYLIEIMKLTPSAANIVVYARQVSQATKDEIAATLSKGPGKGR